MGQNSQTNLKINQPREDSGKYVVILPLFDPNTRTLDKA